MSILPPDLWDLAFLLLENPETESGQILSRTLDKGQESLVTCKRLKRRRTHTKTLSYRITDFHSHSVDEVK